MFKDEIIMNRGTSVIRSSLEQLKKEATELEVQIRQLQVDHVLQSFT